MSSKSCPQLPDWVAGRLPSGEARAVAAHVDACAECAAEAGLLRALLAARPEAPRDLAPRVSAALRDDEPVAPRGRAVRRWPRWAASAAAVLVLAAGGYWVGIRDAPDFSGLGQIATEEASGWISDDGIVAGAPVLDELSDDALLALLEEMGG